jgi:membrane protein required for colicin V production
MAFTITDAVVLLIVLISAMLAHSRGLTREALAIGGWVVAAATAFWLGPLVEPFTREIPVVGDFLRSSCTISALAAFVLVFAGMLMVLAIFTPVVSGLVRDGVLGPIDRAFGFVFGAARGLVLVAVLFMLYDLVAPTDQRLPAIDNAASIRLIGDTATLLREHAPTEVPDWLSVRIDRLTGACGAPGPGGRLTTALAAG